MKARFDAARIEAARKELEECGGYIVNMPLGVAPDGCFYSIGGGFGGGLWIDRETCNGEFRYIFSGDFDQAIADLYTAIEGGAFFVMRNEKEIKEMLMEAITNFIVAEKAGDHFASGYHMGHVHAYLIVLGENARIYSPWHSLWRHVFACTL